MAIHFIDINNKEIVKFTNKLEKMKKSDLPVSIRETLNNMAFDVKINTLQMSVQDKFIIRNRTFFKRFSSVKKAEGFDIYNMQSEVGISPGQNIAAKQLKTQELGGRLKKRSYIYMSTARIGRLHSRQVKRSYYLNKKGIVQGSPTKRRSEKSQFIADAFIAEKENKFMLKKSKAGTTAFIVDKIKLTGSGKNRKAFAKTIAIADYEENRSVNIRSRPFVKPASIESGKKGNEFFIKQYEKRIKRKAS